MPDDVLLAKAALIERALSRVREEYQQGKDRLETDFRVQDSLILNLQRASETSISGAMHLVQRLGAGLPQDSRDAFRLLAEKAVLEVDLARKMQAMVVFRNLAIHEYQKLDWQIIRAIIEERLVDFEALVKVFIARAQLEADV